MRTDPRSLGSSIRSAVVFVLLATGIASAARASVTATYYRAERDLPKLTPDAGNVGTHASRGWVYEIAERDTGGRRLLLRFHHFVCPDGVRPPDATNSEEVRAGGQYWVDEAELVKSPLFAHLVQSLDLGLIAVPWKIRGKAPGASAQWSGEASLGTGIGYRFATDLLTTHVEPVLYFGLSQVAITTPGESTATQVTARTLGTGFQIDIGDRFKLGAMVGWDWPFGADGESWAYRGRPWYSLALNVAVLTRADPDL